MTSKSTFQHTMGKAASKSGSLFSVVSEIEITDFQLLVQQLFHQIWVIFRSPSDGDLMIPPWTFCDGFGEAISVLFCKKK